jgi:Tfp pilus assembly protein PilO
MFGLPMEIVGPVIGIGAIISFVVAGLAVLRLLPTSSRHHLKSEERQMLDELQARLGDLDELKQRVGELEERADFAERLLAQQRETPRLSAPQG